MLTHIVLYFVALLVLVDHLMVHPRVNWLSPPFEEIIALFTQHIGQAVV